MKVFILSDIHGNREALKTVIDYISNKKCDGLILLGDVIDYGPHSNEVIEMLQKVPYQVLCNIQGNHEDAILRNQYQRFSSSRGVDSAKYTKAILNEKSLYYLMKVMNQNGIYQFSLGDKKCLAVHGRLQDEYWGKFSLADDLQVYAAFDYVFTGHSHKPHFFEFFSKTDNPEKRNLKKTIFINPGSVGQPRNLNPKAQFACFDTESEECELIKLDYDIEKEQSFFSDSIDVFYKKRLEVGV